MLCSTDEDVTNLLQLEMRIQRLRDGAVRWLSRASWEDYRSLLDIVAVEGSRCAKVSFADRYYHNDLQHD